MNCDVCVLPFEEAVAVALPPPVEVELAEVPPALLLLTLVLELPTLARSACSQQLAAMWGRTQAGRVVPEQPKEPQTCGSLGRLRLNDNRRKRADALCQPGCILKQV